MNTLTILDRFAFDAAMVIDTARRLAREAFDAAAWRAMKHLYELDSHLLDDIGINRGDIEDVVLGRKPGRGG